MIKLYDRYMEKICALRRLSHLEITIISFLHNNPGCDTARDISEMRMLPKGNVSQGVESLIQKGLLGRETDGADRRRIHLTLTEAANPIVEEIEAAKALFLSLIHISHSASVAPFARGLYERGYSLLLPDARAHGESEGKWIGMGWPDRLDLLDWIRLLGARFGAPEILLMGVSMGGATVMNAAGEPLPENVKCIVEDCGYVSLADEFRWQLRHFYHLPANCFLLPASPVSRLLAGYSPLRDGDGCAQLARARRPMLFIHGGADRFVPPEMLRRAFAAASCPKEMRIIPGAPHADSIAADPEAYWAAIDAFLEKYFSPVPVAGRSPFAPRT